MGLVRPARRPSPRRALVLLSALSAGLLLQLPGSASAETEATVACRFSADFREVSGLAASVQHPGVLWLHEDSGSGPSLHAIDAGTCATLASLRITGVPARDFEAVGMGAMPDGSPAIWLGDIGDNRDSWPWVEVLRIREPAVLRDREVRAQSFRVTYPDRPHDAETLLVHGTRLWIVTKQLARGSLYRLPDPLSPTTVNVATRLRAETGLVTDGAIAPDGSRYVLRDYFDAQLFEGLPPGRPGARVDLPIQRQGEAITFSSDGRALYAASERDRRLFRIVLPASPGATASASPAASSAGDAGEAAAPSSTEAADASTGAGMAAWWIAGIGALVIGALFVAAERRRRRA